MDQMSAEFAEFPVLCYFCCLCSLSVFHMFKDLRAKMYVELMVKTRATVRADLLFVNSHYMKKVQTSKTGQNPWSPQVPGSSEKQQTTSTK